MVAVYTDCTSIWRSFIFAVCPSTHGRQLEIEWINSYGYDHTASGECLQLLECLKTFSVVLLPVDLMVCRDVQKCTRYSNFYPSHWTHHFACDNSSVLKLKVNRVLKILADALFPLCFVSWVDRLESRIKGLGCLLSPCLKMNKFCIYKKQWIPQLTGVY